MATTSTVPGSKPAARRDGTMGSPAYPRIATFFASSRSPIPVSISRRPAGVSTSRQLSAWSSRRFSSSSPSAQSRHRIHGTGPRIAPESVRNVPAWISATLVPPPRSARQWTASLMPSSGLLAGPPARGPASLMPSSGLLAGPPVAVAVDVDGRRRGLELALVLGPERPRAVRPLDGAAHPEEADLADPHPGVEGDREVRHVRQLEREGPLPAGVDVARRRVDQQAEAAEARPSFQPRHDVVRELHPLQRPAEHELARVEDERLLVRDREQLGEVGLRLARVDEGVAVVAEDAERAVEVEVDRRRLEIRRVIRVDPHAARLELRSDVAVREDAHRAGARLPLRGASSSNSWSTSRLRSARSSKLWYTDANRM